MGDMRTVLYALRNKARDSERLEARKENNRIEVLEKKGGCGTRSTSGGICL